MILVSVDHLHHPSDVCLSMQAQKFMIIESSILINDLNLVMTKDYRLYLQRNPN